jgi:hypothetical protein
VANSGGTVSFKYDPFGKRIYKSSSSGTSVFAYDGDNLIEETNTPGTVVARYSQRQNIDEPLAGGAPFEMVLIFRVAAPSRSFEGAEGLAFSLE